MIAEAKNIKKVYKTSYDTHDIIDLMIIANNNDIWKDTTEFSKQFEPTYEGMRKLWNVMKNEITYKADPVTAQHIRTPARTWKDRKLGTDCKSFTIFASSIFQNLRLKYFFRFASYTNSKIPTHVYAVVILQNGQEVIMDVVWTSFDNEKDYSHKIDKRMELAVLSGVNDKISVIRDSIEKFSFGGSPMATNLHVNRESFLISAVQNPQNAELYINKAYELTVQLENLPQINGFLDKAKAKILTPILKFTLPKLSGFFLYGVTNTNTIGNLHKVRAKASKQYKIINWIASVSGISATSIRGIIINGVRKNYGKTPDQMVNDLKKSKGINGVGSITLTAVIAAIVKFAPAIIGMINKVAALFRKKKIDASSADAPSMDDFPDYVPPTPTTQRPPTQRPIPTTQRPPTQRPTPTTQRPPTTVETSRPTTTESGKGGNNEGGGNGMALGLAAIAALLLMNNNNKN